MKPPKVLKFHKSLLKDILGAFGKEVRDGFVVDKTTGKPVLDEDGDAVPEKSFAGFRRGSDGSLIPVTNDIISIIRFANYLREA